MSNRGVPSFKNIYSEEMKLNQLFRKPPIRMNVDIVTVTVRNLQEDPLNCSFYYADNIFSI